MVTIHTTTLYFIANTSQFLQQSTARRHNRWLRTHICTYGVFMCFSQLLIMWSRISCTRQKWMQKEIIIICCRFELNIFFYHKTYYMYDCTYTRNTLLRTNENEQPLPTSSNSSSKSKKKPEVNTRTQYNWTFSFVAFSCRCSTQKKIKIIK